MIRSKLPFPAEHVVEDRDLRASGSPAPRRNFVVRILIPSLLCLLYGAQCAWFIGTQSMTADEPEHIAAGLDAWRHGEFRSWDDQPPLARLLFALPLLDTNWRFETVAGEIEPIRPGPESWAWRARPVNVLLGFLLAGLLWTTARRRFSAGAANFALALFVFSPALIAHFSVAAIDGVATLLIFATALQVARWRRQPSFAETLLLGLVLGGLLLAKFHTLPLFALAMGVVLLHKPHASLLKPWAWNWRALVIVFASAFFTVWAGYFFHVSRVTFQPGQVTATFSGYSPPLVQHLPVSFHAKVYIPACEYLTGFGNVVHHSWVRGHRSFFLGEVSQRGGWKLYFPVVILLKWPTTVLLLAAAMLALTARRRLIWPVDFRVLMLFPAVFFFFAVFSRINIGDRHILPIYPFVLLACAALWEYARRQRALQALLVAAVLAQAADGLRYAPDYLSYFNVFVRPERSYTLLSDSNLDWGQGLIALRRYEQQHPGEELHLAYFGRVRPSLYGIRAAPLEETDRVTGTVVVSATHLTGQYLRNPSSYHWVLQYPRKTILNHTLHVFDVPREPHPHQQSKLGSGKM